MPVHNYDCEDLSCDGSCIEASRFTNYDDAAKAITETLSADIVGTFAPEYDVFASALFIEIRAAIEKDGKLPNDYEVRALCGQVPVDGSDDEDTDHDCPPSVREKFPHVDKVIMDQF